MSALSTLLSEYRTLPTAAQRAVSAIVGAAVGDAASRPVHWLYDRPTLEAAIGTKDPEFWPVNLSPFYTVPTGRRSCYNDEAFAMLRSLPAYPGVYDKNATRSSLLRTFATDSEYAEAMARRVIAYDPSQKDKKKDPIEGPWQQGAVTSYLKAVAANEAVTGETKNVETDGFCLALPLIVRLSAQKTDLDFASTVEEAVKTLSAAESAVAHSAVRALILRDLIQSGASAPGTFEYLETAVRRSIVDSVLATAPEDIAAEYQATLSAIPSTAGEGSVWGEVVLRPAYLDAVQTFGKACPDPGNFQASLLAILSTSTYTEGIRRNILGGGCNCSRANFIGAALGAAYGLGEKNGVPLEWLEQTDRGLETLELALGLFRKA